MQQWRKVDDDASVENWGTLKSRGAQRRTGENRLNASRNKIAGFSRKGKDVPGRRTDRRTDRRNVNIWADFEIVTRTFFQRIASAINRFQRRELTYKDLKFAFRIATYAGTRHLSSNK